MTMMNIAGSRPQVILKALPDLAGSLPPIDDGHRDSFLLIRECHQLLQQTNTSLQELSSKVEDVQTQIKEL